MAIYLPQKFEQADSATLVEFIRDNAFATLITPDAGLAQVSHLPMQINDAGSRLYGHLARANPHHEMLEDRTSLAVFQGPHCYISPRWYSQKGVPTWNFMTVHARVTARMLPEPADCRRVVDELSAVYERGRSQPWSSEELDDRFLDANLKAIIAFELTVEELTGKFKLSQNRMDEDRRRVIAELENGSDGERMVARAMNNNEQAQNKSS